MYERSSERLAAESSFMTFPDFLAAFRIVLLENITFLSVEGFLATNRLCKWRYQVVLLGLDAKAHTLVFLNIISIQPNYFSEKSGTVFLYKPYLRTIIYKHNRLFAVILG